MIDENGEPFLVEPKIGELIEGKLKKFYDLLDQFKSVAKVTIGFIVTLWITLFGFVFYNTSSISSKVSSSDLKAEFKNIENDIDLRYDELITKRAFVFIFDLHTQHIERILSHISGDDKVIEEYSKRYLKSLTEFLSSTSRSGVRKNIDSRILGNW